MTDDRLWKAQNHPPGRRKRMAIAISLAHGWTGPSMDGPMVGEGIDLPDSEVTGVIA